jgi:hypothetical protein
MTARLAAVLFAAVLSLQAADAPGQPPEETRTERMPFARGGTVRLNNSYGYLNVEGWDKDEVEITVTKSRQKDKTPRRFEEISVVAEKASDQELAISTTLPERKNLIASILPSRRIVFTMPVHTSRGVTVEYTVRVPRDSRLVVRHDNGYVWISDVTGDIDVRSHTGDMIVMLPKPGPYSIDAQTRLGGVSSDFPGNGRYHLVLGSHFTDASPSTSRHVYLRMGRGSITIKQSGE